MEMQDQQLQHLRVEIRSVGFCLLHVRHLCCVLQAFCIRSCVDHFAQGLVAVRILALCFSQAFTTPTFLVHVASILGYH